MKRFKQDKIIALLRGQSLHAHPTSSFKKSVLRKLNERLENKIAAPYVDTPKNYRFLFATAVTFSLIALIFISLGIFLPSKILTPKKQDDLVQPNIAFKPFNSPYEFSQYLSQSAKQYSQPAEEKPQQVLRPPVTQRLTEGSSQPSFPGKAPGSLPTAESKAGDVPTQKPEQPLDRVSQTNVQVLGIDEPDIAKVSGKYIYYSPSEIKIIKAFPLKDLSLVSRIQKSGNLLIQDKTLVVFDEDNQMIQSYDISTPNSPKEIWTMNLQNESSYTHARLYNGKIYIITQTKIDRNKPCPYQPFRINDYSFTIIPCNNIYHPYAVVPSDTTYTVMILNPLNGNVEKTLSFIGSSKNSVVYMSENSLYVAYHLEKDMFSLLHSFYLQEGKKFLPEDIIDQMQALSTYSISAETKLRELEFILESYYNLLLPSEQTHTRYEITKSQEDFLNRHQKDKQSTQIIKIQLDGFQIVAINEISGYLLNQFSLDEYNDKLRVATTIDDATSNAESINNVYVLDKNLQIIGEVTNLGLNEKIYSVRFIHNNAYIVTFRETDPFYVLDLSDPTNPQLKGQLKIPGYSSYLHRIDENKILGVGLESGQLKLSLFDVSNPESPVEVAKFFLNEYSSEVLSNHHAFLHDPRHKVFFIPATKGGYVFSYANNQLTQRARVDLWNTKRAIYFNNYLYVLGDNELVVLNETSWREEKRISL